MRTSEEQLPRGKQECSDCKDRTNSFKRLFLCPALHRVGTDTEPNAPTAYRTREHLALYKRTTRCPGEEPSSWTYNGIRSSFETVDVLREGPLCARGNSRAHTCSSSNSSNKRGEGVELSREQISGHLRAMHVSPKKPQKPHRSSLPLRVVCGKIPLTRPHTLKHLKCSHVLRDIACLH